MVVIDYQNRKPIYEQIVERFQMLIVKGILEPDSQMPSVRALATKYDTESLCRTGTGGVYLSGKRKGKFCFGKSGISQTKKRRFSFKTAWGIKRRKGNRSDRCTMSGMCEFRI